MVLLGLGLASTLLTLWMLSLQSGVHAYIAGNAEWTMAQRASIARLEAYLDSGDNRQLQLAGEYLEVPLSDRLARMEMDRPEMDRELVRSALLDGNNRPRDIPRLISFYRQFRDFEMMAEPVAIWRATDPYVLELERLHQQLLTTPEQRLDPQAREALRSQLMAIGERLDDMSTRFANVLHDNLARLNAWVVFFVAGAHVLLTLGAGLIILLLVRRLNASQRRLSAAFEQAAVGIVVVDLDGRIEECNPAFAAMLGHGRNSLLSADLRRLTHPADRPDTRERLQRLQLGELGNMVVEKRFLRSDQSSCWTRITVTPLRGRAGQVKQGFMIVEDMTEPHRMAEELRYRTRFDALTGLRNRSEFERCLAQTLKNLKSGDIACLLFIDLDQFKLVNDTCGHQAGDEFLRELAQVMDEQLHEQSVLARLGGDEFAVLLNDCDEHQALIWANRLQQAVEAHVYERDGRTFRLSASAGVVQLDSSTPDGHWAMRAADTACNIAKEQGRRRINVYDEDDEHMAVRQNEMEWISRIRHALRADRLELAAQRIINLKDGDEIRYELLLRLRDESGRVFMPGEFLPAAERYNLISAVDEWVVRKALEILSARPEHLQQLGACHVNLSALSIGDIEFQTRLESMLDDHPQAAHRLCFEVTETAAVGSLEKALDFFAAVRSRGATVALDDFGSGQASFAYLKQLDVDIIKIDGMFVRNLTDNAVDHAIVSAITQIGDSLAHPVVAEFVDNDKAFEELGRLGVTYAQGFALHRPEPFGDLLSQFE